MRRLIALAAAFCFAPSLTWSARGPAMSCLDKAAQAGSVAACEGNSAQSLPVAASSGVRGDNWDMPLRASQTSPSRAIPAVEETRTYEYEDDPGEGFGAGWRYGFRQVERPAAKLLQKSDDSRMDHVTRGSTDLSSVYGWAGVLLGLILAIPAALYGVCTGISAAVAGAFSGESDGSI